MNSLEERQRRLLPLKTGECSREVELYWLKGTLTLQQKNQKSKACPELSRRGKRQKSKIKSSPQHPTPSTQAEAEAYFLKAIEIARKQQAKSLELRAVMSLSRLWQRQGKPREDHKMLSEVYGWFTEGFDTKDLQEAKALLEALNRTSRDWHTRVVTLNEVKGLSEGFFATLRMTWLSGCIVTCPNVMRSDLVRDE